MEAFDEALLLFDAYQKKGGINKLRDALDILDDIIGNQGVALQRAINLKKTISQYTDRQITLMRAKYNIGEFDKDITNHPEEKAIDEFVSGLFASAPASEAKKLIELILIRFDYWKTQ
jgi:hypothetical protein